MRFDIDADPVGPLQLLRSVSTASLARLEGLNGIGKTLTIRLLQICTGDMPYRLESASWDSLCRGLGRFQVIATELNGANTIEWVGDSRSWLERTPPQGPADFEHIRIDGKSATLDNVRDLLVVHRLAGDEDLVTTLAGRAENDADVVSRWSSRYAGREAGPLATLETTLGGPHDEAHMWASNQYEQIRTEEQEAIRRRKAAVERLDVAHRNLELAREGQRLTSQLDQLSEELPELRRRVSEIDDQIQSLTAQRTSINTEIRQLSGLVAASKPVMEELSNARRTLNRNREKLSHELDRFAVAAAHADVEPEADAISHALEEAEAEARQLGDRQRELDKAPAMRGLIDETSALLSTADETGLGDQILLEQPATEIQLTVQETRDGLSLRREQLEGQPPPPEARGVEEGLKAARRCIALLENAAEAASDVARFRRLVGKNQRRVDAALSQLDEDASQRLKEIESRLQEVNDQLLGLAAERAGLNQKIGGLSEAGSAEVASQRLQDVADELGVKPPELADRLDALEEAVQKAEFAKRQASQGMQAVKKERARADAALARLAEAWERGPDHEFMRTALPKRAIPRTTQRPSEQAAALLAAARILDRVQDRLGSLRDQLGGVETALRGLASRMQGGELAAEAYVSELEAWLGERFSDWFNLPIIRQELLREADGDIVVRLGDSTVAWREGEVERARPLAAFSSGEQAFAYTRARLAMLDERGNVSAANRLIALDEFGAFIAHDRLTGLLKHLQERAVQHRADQVLVILPLSQDYRELAAKALEPEDSRLRGLAEQIDRQGYAIHEMVP